MISHNRENQHHGLNILKFSTVSSWIWVLWFTCIFTCIHVRDVSIFRLSPSQKYRAVSPLSNAAELRDDTEGVPAPGPLGFSQVSGHSSQIIVYHHHLKELHLPWLDLQVQPLKKKKVFTHSTHSEVNMRVYCSQATPFRAHSFSDICSGMLKPWAPLAGALNSEICSTCSRGAIFGKELLPEEKQQLQLVSHGRRVNLKLYII